MVEPTDLVERKEHAENSTAAILENLTTRMTQVLTENQTQTQVTTYDTSTAQIGIKLDGSNYALWS